MIKSILLTCFMMVCSISSMAQSANSVSLDTTQQGVNGKYRAATAAIPNDVNNDGLVDALDVVHIVKYVNNKPLTGFKVEKADINNDGKVDLEDANSLSKLVTGIEVPAADPPGEEPETPPSTGALKGSDAIDPIPPTI